MIQKSKKARSVYADKPICLGTAAGGMVKPLIFRAVFQMGHAVPDRFILHGGNPEALDRLAAPGEIIHVPEDQLSLAPGVTGVYDIGHIFPSHEAGENLELLHFFRAHNMTPFRRDDRQIPQIPRAVFCIVDRSVCKPGQVAKAPGNEHVVALQIPVPAFLHTERGGDGLGYRRFLSNDEFQSIFYPPILLLIRQRSYQFLYPYTYCRDRDRGLHTSGSHNRDAPPGHDTRTR